MSTYAEKLKDPRWQKKRLKVLERDKWTCQTCDDKDSPLHVHHLKYAKTGNPWGARMDDLETLCADCHVIASSMERDTRESKKELRDIIDNCSPPNQRIIVEVAKIVRGSPNTRATLKNVVVYLVEIIDRTPLGSTKNSES